MQKSHAYHVFSLTCMMKDGMMMKEKNGIGCFVSCSPGALIESGAVSQVRVEELWLGF